MKKKQKRNAKGQAAKSVLRFAADSCESRRDIPWHAFHFACFTGRVVAMPKKGSRPDGAWITRHPKLVLPLAWRQTWVMMACHILAQLVADGSAKRSQE